MSATSDLATMLLWASLWLAVAAFVVRGLIWLLRPASPGVQQTLWLLVLVQGVLLLRVPVEIPWYEAEASQRIASVPALELARPRSDRHDANARHESTAVSVAPIEPRTGAASLTANPLQPAPLADGGPTSFAATWHWPWR